MVSILRHRPSDVHLNQLFARRKGFCFLFFFFGGGGYIPVENFQTLKPSP